MNKIEGKTQEIIEEYGGFRSNLLFGNLGTVVSFYVSNFYGVAPLHCGFDFDFRTAYSASEQIFQ